jgi:arsenate reductase
MSTSTIEVAEVARGELEGAGLLRSLAVLPGLLRRLRRRQLLMADRVVLFVCVENAGRSLMAESVFNSRPPPGWIAISAGTRPATAPHPRTARMLAEIGCGLPSHAPQLLTPEMMDGASVRVSMGCLDDAACPARLKTREVSDWALEDPGPLDDAGFRRVRDAIVDRVDQLRSELRRRERGSPAWTRAGR